MAELDADHRIGAYQIIGRLGGGAMGTVHLARSPSGRLVAVKVVRPDLAEDPRFRERFRREIAMARAVGGFWTAAVVDADPDAERPWLATEYVPGLDLHEAIRSAGALPPDAVHGLAAGLAEALAAIHAAGLVHRDLKPSNVLLAADGPRVIDFGISKALEGAGLTATGMVVGTPGYLSPEQIEGREVGPAADVFAFGAVVVFAASGRNPFGEGDTAAMLYRAVHTRPDLRYVPHDLRDLVARCLERRAGARPTAPALVAALGGRVAADWLPISVRTLVDQRHTEIVAARPATRVFTHDGPHVSPRSMVRWWLDRGEHPEPEGSRRPRRRDRKAAEAAQAGPAGPAVPAPPRPGHAPGEAGQGAGQAEYSARQAGYSAGQGGQGGHSAGQAGYSAGQGGQAAGQAGHSAQQAGYVAGQGGNVAGQAGLAGHSAGLAGHAADQAGHAAGQARSAAAQVGQARGHTTGGPNVQASANAAAGPAVPSRAPSGQPARVAQGVLGRWWARALGWVQQAPPPAEREPDPEPAPKPAEQLADRVNRLVEQARDAMAEGQKKPAKPVPERRAPSAPQPRGGNQAVFAAGRTPRVVAAGVGASAAVLLGAVAADAARTGQPAVALLVVVLAVFLALVALWRTGQALAPRRGVEVTAAGLSWRRGATVTTLKWPRIARVRVVENKNEPWLVVWPRDPAALPGKPDHHGGYRVFPIGHGRSKSAQARELRELRAALGWYGRSAYDPSA